jgi:hypothetical protein
MKNFPHQINELPRLTRALGVFARLVGQNQDLDDDGVVGDSLARDEVYTFRNPGGRAVDELLRAEHAKRPANQGTRTCARELRRFFALLGFIRQTEDGAWVVTETARALLALNQRQATHDIWRQALLRVELTDAGGTSHPYQILLRMVIAMPGLSKPFAGLCFEARDDSGKELRRILSIAGRPNPSETMNALAGAHMARNSLKILPSIAEQLGDLHGDGSRLFISEHVADALGPEKGMRETCVEAVQRLVRRPYVPRKRAAGGKRREPGGVEPAMHSYDPDRVGARFNAHEDCLDSLSRLFPANVEQWHASYDLLLVIPKVVLLVEAKTIRSDARRQARAALGQLLYYEHFDIAPLHPDKEVCRLTLTDRELGQDLQEFLTKYQIGIVWILESGEIGGTKLGLAHLRRLGARIRRPTKRAQAAGNAPPTIFCWPVSRIRD